ncbi:protein disulfide family, partial [Genlisea aurea]
SSAEAVETPFSARSRSILRSTGDGEAEKPDYAVELNADNFDVVLKETGATYAIVGFFAQWCPHCRAYKPLYEKVAKLFNGENAAYPGIILMAKVDCAMKMNYKLCQKFSVPYLPFLLWGPSSGFAYGKWNGIENSNEMHVIDHGKTSEQLLDWINEQTNSSFVLDDKNYGQESSSWNFVQISRAISDVEEATHTAFDIIVRHKMIKSDTRASLVKFLQLLVVHHPSRSCRKGTAEVLIDFDDRPFHEKETIESYEICGKDVPRGSWVFCRGSRKDTRGYSCGLWILLHSLSVRVNDGEAHMAFATICDFVRKFFICEECRRHFYEMCSSVDDPFENGRDLVLWLWDAHNTVNERLMEEEESSPLAYDDPEFPKTIWPPKQLCASCRNEDGSSIGNGSSSRINWNREAVYKFLVGFYGEKLVEEAKQHTTGRSSDSVMVPFAAALAIALGSCSFAALAFYRRQRRRY